MIPVFKPSLGKKELNELYKIFKTGWIGLGPKTAEFEKNFAGYIGVGHAVGVNSCTAALHLALSVIGVKGKEVITTSMTFVSTNHAILYNEGIPVFCDIEADTLNIDADKIEALITEKTKAIVAVHYGGHACDMNKILKIAQKYNLRIIEDVAHGCGGGCLMDIGGEKRWKKLGSIGDLGCFSFHAVKNLATGDGGMITTNDDNLAQRLRKLRWLGVNKGTWDRTSNEKGYSWSYDVEELGFKCHMNDITAVIGLVQLEKLDKGNKKRAEITKIYNKAFKGIGKIEIPVLKSYARSSYHNYVIKTEKRNDLIEHLKKNGIAAGMHYIPNHFYNMYKGYKASLPVTERVWERLITLPVFPEMTKVQVNKVISKVKEFIG